VTAKITSQEFGLLRDLIEKQSGILLADEKAYLVENRLSPLVARNGLRTFGDLYFKAMAGGPRNSIIASILEAITTKETSWFRGSKTFDLLRDPILTGYYKDIRLGRRREVNIWSAACSTGQEPYSIAMTALETYRTMGGERACTEQIRVLGSDISPISLATARAGVYESTSVQRGVPAEYLERYFDKTDQYWRIKDTVRNMATFHHINLREPFSTFGPFDVIFLRNVTIYFSESFKQDLFNRITRVLRPGGYLFLGTGETVTRYAKDMHTQDSDSVLYYQYLPESGRPPGGPGQ
jgi:chemotaxis protein methyltransferase CheR